MSASRFSSQEVPPEKQQNLVGGADERTFLLEDAQRRSSSTYGTPKGPNNLDAYYDENLQYTTDEEDEVVQILDRKLFPFILLTTFVLNMDRTNISNAISDNLAQDLGFTMNTINTATAIYAVLFATFCMTGAIAAKIAGPSRCMFPPLLPFRVHRTMRLMRILQGYQRSCSLGDSSP
jgi:hypothetical protein